MFGLVVVRLGCVWNTYWVRRRAFWSRLEAILGGLGRFLEGFWRVLGTFWDDLGSTFSRIYCHLKQNVKIAKNLSKPLVSLIFEDSGARKI